MKLNRSIFIVVFLMAGMGFVTAQEIINLRRGNMIVAKIIEISNSVISYKRFEDQNGPTFVIPKNNVLSIRYMGGAYEIINAEPVTEKERTENMIVAKIIEIPNPEISYTRFENQNGPTFVVPKDSTFSIRYMDGAFETEPVAERGYTREEKSVVQKGKHRNKSADNDELAVGIAANPAGLLLSGPSTTVELTKRQFNTELNLIFPSSELVKNDISIRGWGGLGTFNYLHETKNGAVYAGGGIGYMYALSPLDQHIFTFGLNGGYRFETSSGMYYRLGGFIGGRLSSGDAGGFSFYLKPDLSVGYNF